MTRGASSRRLFSRLCEERNSAVCDSTDLISHERTERMTRTSQNRQKLPSPLVVVEKTNVVTRIVVSIPRYHISFVWVQPCSPRERLRGTGEGQGGSVEA